jgi:hypothetical protein
VLVPGAVGTISGKVLNLQGAPMTTACVVAYLPNQYALFAPVNPDGTYQITGVPSGTYALAALGCDPAPNPVVPDPLSSSVAYTAQWWDGIPLFFDQSVGGGPDPIAQGATLVTVAPAAQLVDHDWCFGCAAIAISGVTPGSASLTVEFTTPGLVDATDATTSAVAGEGVLVYSATCTSSTGGAGGTATGTGAIAVTGLSAGATYTCQVTATDGATPVASSAVSAAVTLAGGTDPASPTDSIPAVPEALAFTGKRDVTTTACVGLLMVLLGLAAIGAARRLPSVRQSPMVERR